MGLMGARVIGIDVGTSGVRAAALADDGATVGSAAVAMTAFGDATDPATWWDCVRAVISELGSSCDLSQVRALAVDGTSGTMLAVDRFGEPVGPARMYDEPCDDDAVIASDRGTCASRKRSSGSHVRVGARFDDAGSAECSPHAAPGRLDQRQAQRKVRPQRLEQCAEDGLRPGRRPMARLDRTNRRGSCKIACRSGARRRHWSGQRRGRRSRHTGVGDCACRNDGRLRLVSRDRRLRGGRRRDRARIDAGRQASVRPPDLRSGVRHLQPSDWLDVARRRRLEYRRQGHRAVLSARSSCGAFRGLEAGEAQLD